MAINLNDSLYGAQFRAFQALADDTKLGQDALVSVDESNRGKGLLNEAGERMTIVVKNDGDEIKSFTNPFFSRKQNQIDLNNEVRNLFKETVLKICGVKTLDDLPKAVLSVMRKGDYDNEGHPLSLRRIRAVTSAILAEADREAKVAGGTATMLETQGSTIASSTIHEIQGQNIEEVDETESSADEEEIEFKYDTPDYLAGLPLETEEKFMAFYCDAVDKSIAAGQRKEDCDETLGEMFKVIGYNKNDRRELAELLAGGKPRFLEADGSLPFKFFGVKFAERFKAVLDQANEYRAKLPKAYGDIVADTILATLKTADRQFTVDDLKPIDAEFCKDIAATAKKIEAGKLLSPPPGKIRSAKSLARALDAFRREAAEKYAAELLKLNDSGLMTKIKQNLLMSMALAHGGAATESLAEEIEENSDELAAKYGMQDLLTTIAPGLAFRSNLPPRGV